MSFWGDIRLYTKKASNIRCSWRSCSGYLFPLFRLLNWPVLRLLQGLIVGVVLGNGIFQIFESFPGKKHTFLGRPVGKAISSLVTSVRRFQSFLEEPWGNCFNMKTSHLDNSARWSYSLLWLFSSWLCPRRLWVKQLLMETPCDGILVKVIGPCGIWRSTVLLSTTTIHYRNWQVFSQTVYC